MSKVNINSFDIFFMSFDEPDAEANWANLLSLAPWAKRVHGVKGFDAAHKRCAELSTTDRFITVDGDNLVHPSFFDLEFQIPDHLSDCVLSWAGRNVINGLVYGNGGLKLWTKDFVLGMKTHESADSDAESVDFCWDAKYVQLNGMYSDTLPNGSPFQAFRAGFREGVKMTLDRGVKIAPADIKDVVYEKNLKRLLIWASVGADAENGDWAIYGTRLGILKSIDKDWDMSLVSDYDWFKTFWTNDILAEVAKHDWALESHVEPFPFDKKLSKLITLTLSTAIIKVGDLVKKATGMDIAYLDADQSRFFKAVYEVPVRTINPIATEIEEQSKKEI